MRIQNHSFCYIAFLLMIAFIVSSTTGSRPGMDTSLSNSSASFIGDDPNDWFGSSVAIVGDVNRDGYDDILVGAPNYGTDGAPSGYAYLVFGRKSGWKFNLKTSEVDASFRGENDADLLGCSVAGAGDVNGDGYDDILIGAWGNDDGGSMAGKAYLFLGRASGWSRDTDLSNANATFIGEEDGDHAGYSVAGAGDVNGDGYDDILVGANCNDEGPGTDPGQVYLILGKPTGWNKDTDLSNVSASFYGEYWCQYSGDSVAGAGDVNGDGYDDILIGGTCNSGEGTTFAGETYLILGKASGWSMDVNLSRSDASFKGEHWWDHSGCSVAGAGDVNHDGFDDFLIGAYRNAEGGDKAGETYLIFGRSTGWSMNVNLSKANASFIGENKADMSGYSVSGAGDVNGDGYDDFLIGAYGNSEEGSNAGQTYLILGKATGWSTDTDLSDADASFLGRNVGDESGKAVAGGGDVNADGYSDILIGAPRDDTGGTDCGRVFLIFFDDGMPPVLEHDHTPSMATTGDPFTFNVSVSDNRGILNVTVEMWYGDTGYHYNQTMVMVAGDQENGTWTVNITIPSDSVEPLHYQVHVRDRAFNLVTSIPRDVTVVDNDPPVLSDAPRANATTGDVFNLTVNATDNIGITGMTVEYWFGDGVHTNASVDLVSEEIWGHPLTIPEDSLEPLYYMFRAADGASNNATTRLYVANVTDNDPPAFLEDASPDTAETEQLFTFSTVVMDNIGVKGVWVEYWYGDGPHTRGDMNLSGEHVWELGTVVEATVEDLRYVLGSSDVSGNLNVTAERRVRVLDVNGPQLVNEGTSRTATTGDPFEFTFTAGDNVGLRGAKVWYALGDGEGVSAGMDVVSEWPSGNVLYSLVIQVPSDLVGNITYRWEVEDLAGNVLASNVEYVKVVDDDLPVLVEDRTGDAAHTGSPLTILVLASDNVGVDRVEVEYNYGGGEPSTTLMTDLSDGSYAVDLPVPDDEAGPLEYRVRVLDLAGNELSGPPRQLPVVDVLPPELLGVTWGEAVKGLDLAISVEARDNVGPLNITLSYRFGSGSRKLLEMGVATEAVIHVPRHPSGDLNLVVMLEDAAGNKARGTDTEVPLLNLAPSWGAMPAWQVTEGEGSTLDLAPCLTDANDELGDLTLSCADANVSVDGLTLTGLFDVAVPGLTLLVTASDGEDGTVTELSVVIENVNDAPVILSLSPANGTRWREGARVPLEAVAFDEDGDQLEVTWTSGKRTLGTGSTLDVRDLDPGKRRVLVTVSDGEATAEAELSLVIEEEEITSLVWLLPVVIAVAVVALVLRRRARC
jgi:hypothetical protein